MCSLYCFFFQALIFLIYNQLSLVTGSARFWYQTLIFSADVPSQQPGRLVLCCAAWYLW